MTFKLRPSSPLAVDEQPRRALLIPPLPVLLLHPDTRRRYWGGGTGECAEAWIMSKFELKKHREKKNLDRRAR